MQPLGARARETTRNSAWAINSRAPPRPDWFERNLAEL